MKISKPIKVIIGLLTAWLLVSPFLWMGSWFLFMFSIPSNKSQAQPYAGLFLVIFFLFFFLLMVSSFLNIGLKAYYLVHIILNKTGSDVLRSIFGAGLLIFSWLFMPVYYFIYILPDNPPQWALSPNQPVNIKPPTDGTSLPK